MKIISLADAVAAGVSHNPEIEKRVLLRREDVPHLTHFSESRLQPRQVTRAHTHAGMCEVFYVLDGTGAIRIDGLEHRLAAGICVAVEPGESHEIANTGETELTLLYFGIET